jgi:CRP/FNR family transcriptional regulator, cyclic AMP receptor protein
MKEMDALVAEVPALEGLAPDHFELIAGCATNVHFAAGDYVFREAEPANVFYAVRRGAVALEIHVPAREAVVVETLHDGDLLGWSWLFPPYRWSFDARALESTSAISFDGACLRGKCDADHDLGYELMQRIAQVIIERLQATRLRLLDVYGVTSST